MKSVLSFTFTIIVFLAIGYVLGSIAVGNWDIMSWPQDARGVFVIIMIGIIILMIMSQA